MKFRKSCVFGLVVLGVLSLSACDTEYHSAQVSVPDSLDLENKPALNALFPNSGFSDNDFNTGYTASLINEMTGYNVTYNQTTSSDADNLVTNFLTARASYHFMKLGPGQFDAHIGEDAFLPLEGYLAKYGQDLLSVIPQSSWDTVTYNGHIYAIPETAFSSMQDNALIFSLHDLEEAGIESVPTTVDDFTKCLTTLQAYYGTNNSSYHAFSLIGSMPTIPCIANAFDVPMDFFVDGDGKIENYIYSDKTLPYLSYLNGFVRSGVLAQSWSSSTSSDVMSTFVKGNSSVVSLPYWYMVPLYTQLAAVYPSRYPTTDAAKAGISWVLNLRGDGTNGSATQSVAKHQAGVGNAYLVSIPWYMSDDAAYVVDYFNQKIQAANYALFLTGREGEGYSYTTAEDPDGVAITYDGETTYRKLLPTFEKSIKDNSMYATGANAAVGKAFWPMREKGFECWNVLTDIDENSITNPLSLYPVIPAYSKISISAASYVMTLIQQAINSTSSTASKTTAGILTTLQGLYKTKYWTDEVDTAIQTWYSSKKSD